MQERILLNDEGVHEVLALEPEFDAFLDAYNSDPQNCPDSGDFLQLFRDFRGRERAPREDPWGPGGPLGPPLTRGLDKSSYRVISYDFGETKLEF